MINADAGLCGIQIHHILSQALAVSAVKTDAQIILLSVSGSEQIRSNCFK